MAKTKEKFDFKGALTLNTVDSNGKTPDQSWIGQRFTHHNGMTYVITYFTWLGETDEWGVVVYNEMAPMEPTVTRPLGYIADKLKV